MSDYTISALFVDESWIKANTPINGQVDIRTIVPFIQVAQDLNIQSILGTKLYQRLMAGIVATDLSANEITLLNIIRPSLSYFTLAQAIPFIAIEIRGSGVIRALNDKIQPATMSEINIAINSAMNIAEFYAERISNWLCSNSNLYPQYNTETGPIRPDRGSQFNGGFYYSDDDCSDCSI